MSTFLEPQGSASLLLAFKSQSQAILIVGSNSVAASRTFTALDADYKVLLLFQSSLDSASPEIRFRASKNQVEILDYSALSNKSGEIGEQELTSILDARPDIALLCVADTSLQEGSNRRSFESAKSFYNTCRRLRIPVNVSDIPELCTFTFPTSHRFVDPQSNKSTPLQISVATNGKGCRLAGRIKRDIVSKLPKGVGLAVEKVGQLRELAQTTNGESSDSSIISFLQASNSLSPNEPLSPQSSNASLLEKTRHRMRWVAQLSEFWQIERLASLSKGDMHALLQEGGVMSPPSTPNLHAVQSGNLVSHHGLAIAPPLSGGNIYLLGSGIGHPSFLTVAAHEILSRHATLVLSDKLVPPAVLDLVPPAVRIVIARKFPGNADGAQFELMKQAVDAAQQGEIVVRLKQGDPMVYGRAGEEILYFRENGFEPIVIPGLSSAISGPAFANIPVTQRGVADSFIVCTGVGRNGKDVQIPGYRRERTTVILMAVARLSQLVRVLLDPCSERRDGAAYPDFLPVAIIERASMPDQRVVVSTLHRIEDVFTGLGTQRPPGLVVLGWAVLALSAGKEKVNILDDEVSSRDAELVASWLGSSGFKVVEGLPDQYRTV